MLGSCTDPELVDRDLTAHRLLYRLFHEDGVRVFSTRSVQFSCRCSEQKVERVLRALSDEELEDLMVDGLVTVTCEFCRETRAFDRADLGRLRAS